jgi:hypothetical protein
MWLEKYLSADGDSKESARRIKELKNEISRKANELAEKHGIATNLLSLVLDEAADLSLSPERLTEVIKSGLKTEHLRYSPIEEAIKQLGPKLAERIFKFQFGKLLKSWAFTKRLTPQDKFIQTMLPPFFLTQKEWVAAHVQYYDFLTSEKSTLLNEGRPKVLPEISFLLRVLPLTLLDDDRRLLACGKLEEKGSSTDELKNEFHKPASASVIDDDLKEYREKIYSLYLKAYKDLPKNLTLDNFERLTFEISKFIREEFTIGELEGLKEIETQSAEQLGVFNIIERLEAPTLPDVVIKFALAFLLPAFEAENSPDLRAKLSHYIRYTELGFPIIELDFWSELKRKPDEVLDILSAAEDAFHETRKFTFAFIRKVSVYVSADTSIHEQNLSKFEDINSKYINEVISEIDGSLNSEDDDVKIKGTEYIFKNGFRKLHWKKHSWIFKDWERHIVRAFWEAYNSKSKKFLSSDEIHELAMRLRFNALDKEREEKIKNPNNTAVQTKEKSLKRYMFTDVFKNHYLSKRFFVAISNDNKTKSGLYSINPQWNPEIEAKDKATNAKKAKARKQSPKKSAKNSRSK